MKLLFLRLYILIKGGFSIRLTEFPENWESLISDRQDQANMDKVPILVLIDTVDFKAYKLFNPIRRTI